MNTYPDIAVLVLNYNGQQHLEKCFSSLQNQTYTSTIVYLVDNASTDYSIQFTAERFPDIRIIGHSKNLGFTEGYNRAVDIINEPLVVFLNNDTACAPDWLDNLYNPMKNNPRIAAVGSRMVFADSPQILNHGGGYFTLTGIGLDRDFGKSINDPELIKEPFYTAYACGGAALVRRDAFLEVGAFANEYFIYFEDVDLAYRFWLSGYKVMHAPQSVVMHYFSPVFGQESPAKIFLCQKNRLSNMFKHFKLQTLTKAFCISTAYDLRRMSLWLAKKDFARCKAVINGTMYFIGAIPRLLFERKKIQHYRTQSDTWMQKNRLLLDLQSSINELHRLQLIKSGLFE